MSGTDHPPSTTSPTSLPASGRHHDRCRHPRPSPCSSASSPPPPAAPAPRRPPSRATTREDREQIRAFVDGPDALDRIALGGPGGRPAHHRRPPPPPRQPPAAHHHGARPRRRSLRSQPVASGSGYNDPSNPAAWDRLAQCESGGNWAANTGNGYYGGIQFSLGSWQAVGGTGRPDQASRETQIAMGQRLWNQGGWRHWPACTLKLGYR